MANQTPTQPAVSHTVPIAILGTDAVIAALPATPVQLAHACLRAGFANVIPANWGDELIATAVLRRLPQFGNGPAIQCTCPIVAHRLLSVGGDLRPAMLPLVSPPVAVARYVRALVQPARARITYVGACPGAVDESIDIRMTPESLIAMLAERGILLDEQPRVFESVIPPDRRRFRSQPGGVPTTEALWSELGARTLVEIDGEDFVTEIAQHLLSGKNVLIDAAARLGCACSGALPGVRNPRTNVTSLEPPRAAAAIIEDIPSIDLELPVPATSRTPVDVVAVPSSRSQQPAAPIVPHALTPPTGNDVILGGRLSAARVPPPAAPEPRVPRSSNPTVVPRPVLSAFPVARDNDGRSLPRAYVARRRSSPKGIAIVVPVEVTASPIELPKSDPAPVVVAPPPPVAAPVTLPPTTELASPLSAAFVTPAAPAPKVEEFVHKVTPAIIAASDARIVSEIFSKPTPASTTAKVPEPAPVSFAPPSPSSAYTPPAPRRHSPPIDEAPQPSASTKRAPYPDSWSTPAPPEPTGMSRGQIARVLLFATLIAICVGAIVGVIAVKAFGPATNVESPG